MKKGLILGMMFILIISNVQAVSITNDDITYTKLYEAPEEMCDSLKIIVSGVNITSEEYLIQECAESKDKNIWYCNCEDDDEFDVIFIHDNTQTKSYIVDISGDGKTIRRAVSTNYLEQKIINDVKEERENKTIIEEKLVRADETKLNNLESRTKNVETKISEIVTQGFPEPIITNEIKENAYNDTALINRIEKIEKDYTPKVGGVMNFILVAGVIVYLMMENKKRKREVEENKK